MEEAELFLLHIQLNLYIREMIMLNQHPAAQLLPPPRETCLFVFGSVTLLLGAQTQEKYSDFNILYSLTFGVRKC